MNTSQALVPLVLGVAGSANAVANSLSPRMMRAAFDAVGMHGYYVPMALEEASAAHGLRALVHLGFRGCNVTMPFKPVAAQVATQRSDAVARAGVANTLVVEPDGSLTAHATDGMGVLAAIAARAVSLRSARVTMLGAGGSASDVAASLATAGVAHMTIVNRTMSRAEALATRLRQIEPALKLQVASQLPIGEAADVLVSCVPADAIDPEQAAAVHGDPLVVDLAYRRDGAPTTLMAAAQAQPDRCIDGRELLARQGAASFELWTGIDAPIEVMLRAVRT